MASSSRHFPQYLSKKFTALWMETDELVILLVLVGCCLIGKGFMIWLITPTVQTTYIITKRKKPKGFFKHLLYMIGFLNLNGYPEYFEQEFHE